MKKQHVKIRGLIVFLGMAIVCCAAPEVFARTYYVDATSGIDTSVGTCDQPWKTINKVNNFSLLPGDIVFFKRGEVWRERLVLKSGSAAAYITYGAYGMGAKPQIRRSVSANNTEQWINKGNNIWELTNTFPINFDVGNIVLNNNEGFGVKVWSENDLDTQGEYWCDESDNNKTKIYSLGNPASVYDKGIEMCIHEESIRAPNDTSYVLIENLHPCYCAWSGIEISDRSHHIIVRDCDLSYVGGGAQNVPGKVRHGNGINTQMRAHDITIKGCNICECYDAGIALQGYYKHGLEVYNIYIHDNVIKNCEYSFEFWASADNARLHDIYFENNRCLYAGYGWGHSQRPDPKGSHIMNWNCYGTADNISLKNNVFYEANSELGHFGVGAEGIHSDNNVWYKTSGDQIVFAWRYGGPRGSVYLLSEFGKWKRDTNWDANSSTNKPGKPNTVKNLVVVRPY